MIKKIWICDFCGKDACDNMQGLCGWDICQWCRIAILVKVAKEKLINLKPWCKICKGEGHIKERIDFGSYDRPEYDLKKCTCVL
jgi:hypothetical protein